MMRHLIFPVALAAAALAGACASQPVAPPPPWPDTPETREFRQRVLDLAVLYGDSSGLDPNGYLILTRDVTAQEGRSHEGCHRVKARTLLAGVQVGAEEAFEVCKPAKAH